MNVTSVGVKLLCKNPTWASFFNARRCLGVNGARSEAEVLFAHRDHFNN